LPSILPSRYSQDAGFLARWLKALLPDLGLWRNRNAGTLEDPLDRDLSDLMSRYEALLREHRRFEPAWEDLCLTAGTEYLIFFPEILPDFSYYRDSLASCAQVISVPIPLPHAPAPQTFFYPTSRKEITEVARFIRALGTDEGVSWDAIAVSVPDREHYEPYLLREFRNRNIPIAVEQGKALSAYPTGKLFQALEDCVARYFSFDALAALLLNAQLPWKDTEVIAKLMDFGIMHNCLCSWEEEDGRLMDVWEDAFAVSSPSREERVRSWYGSLKKSILTLHASATFGELLCRYERFQGDFFAMDACLPQSRALLTRCMTELRSLTALERAFPEGAVAGPFRFFLEHLQETWYSPGNAGEGVRIFPYRIAAAAPFDWHIVIGATQKDLSVLFSPLAFLPKTRRLCLGFLDEDVSGAFIRLYQLHGRKGTAFFCARHTFSGYALPHSSLKAPREPLNRYETGLRKNDTDPFAEEAAFYQARQENIGKAQFPAALHQVQKQGFNAWYERRACSSASGETVLPPRIMEKIHERYCASLDGVSVVRVSASALEAYYRCALYWLFERVLDLEHLRMETTLMGEQTLGTVYHQVVEAFLTRVGDAGGVLLPLDQGKNLPEAYQEALSRSIDAVFTFASGKIPESPLTIRLLQAQRAVIQEQIAWFLTSFLRYFAGFQVLAAEKALHYHPEGTAYQLTGTLDALLLAPDEDPVSTDYGGTGLIVDFKLHRSPSRDRCIGKGPQGIEQFQLPLYLTMAEQNGLPSIHRGIFFSLVPPKPQVIFGVIQDQSVSGGKQVPYRGGDRIERSGGGEEAFKRILRDFEAKVQGYATDILSGRFSTCSAREKRCFSCPWQSLCRTGYIVAGARCPLIAPDPSKVSRTSLQA
jgi:hypothetical protein